MAAGRGPRSTAFFASSPAATITYGFEVFVHDVIAAITTAPCARWTTSPSSSHGIPLVQVGASATGAGVIASPPVGSAAPGSACAGTSLAGNDSATASSHAVAVVDAEARQAVEEGALRLAERNPVLRPARPRERRLDGREVELHDL